MSTLSPAQIAGYAYQAGFRGSDLTIAVAVALAESGGVTDATHRNSDGSVDHGVWQINSVHSALLRSGDWRDPGSNARMAYSIKTNRGSWRDWATFNHGTYLVHMSAARVATANMVAPGTEIPVEPVANVDGNGITGFVAFLTNPRTWLRLAMIVTGGLLILVGLAMIGWDNAPASVKTIAKAVVTKKVK